MSDHVYKIYFPGKCIFASLIVSFRHGREEDEVMGISFKKELVVDRVQIHPVNKEDEKSKLQVDYNTFSNFSFRFLNPNYFYKCKS